MHNEVEVISVYGNESSPTYQKQRNLLNRLIQLFETPYLDLLTTICKRIYREYNMFFSQNLLWEAIRSEIDATLMKDTLNEIIDWTIEAGITANTFVSYMNALFYNNEAIVKYWLAKQELYESRQIGIYELPVAGSRVDFCKINGFSHAFEIKTSYDQVTRLHKQLDDYLTCFDFVTVIVAKNIRGFNEASLPDNCGVVKYHQAYDKCIFEPIKEPSLTESKNPKIQVACLSSKEIAKHLKNRNLPVPSSRNGREDLMLSLLGEQEIDSVFKTELKSRYKNSWKFLVRYHERIAPIDYQTFFGTQLPPRLVYSSIV